MKRVKGYVTRHAHPPQRWRSCLSIRVHTLNQVLPVSGHCLGVHGKCLSFQMRSYNTLKVFSQRPINFEIGSKPQPTVGVVIVGTTRVVGIAKIVGVVVIWRTTPPINGRNRDTPKYYELMRETCRCRELPSIGRSQYQSCHQDYPPCCQVS